MIKYLEGIALVSEWYGSNHIYTVTYFSPLIVWALSLNSYIILKHKLSVQRNAQLTKADIREEIY